MNAVSVTAPEYLQVIVTVKEIYWTAVELVVVMQNSITAVFVMMILQMIAFPIAMGIGEEMQLKIIVVYVIPTPGMTVIKTVMVYGVGKLN
jgi:hypothetical protein